MKKLAFTLAEVLVTLGIIGVVAAMTMPTLVSNHQKKVYVTQLKKVYTELTQALSRYKNDNNAINIMEAGNMTTTNCSEKFLQKYFNVTGTCTTCFDYSAKTINGTAIEIPDPNTTTGVILPSGAVIKMIVNGKVASELYAVFYIDTNGQKGPNTFGRDLFILASDIDGKVDDPSFLAGKRYSQPGTDENVIREQTSKDCFTSNGGCFSKILMDSWEMKY